MTTGYNPLLQLTPDQVNQAQSAQWRVALRQALADARCAAPAFLTTDMDPVTQTVTAQIATQERVRTATGPQWWDVPPIVYVPIMTPRGGGFADTFPLKKGDEGMLIFCDTCIDFWWQNGQTNSPPAQNTGVVSGTQRQNEVRRHYVHDCGFYPGLWNQRRLLPNYSTTSRQIRTDDGTTTVIDVSTAGVAVTGAAGVGAAQALVNDTFYQWFVADILPFLVSKGYAGPTVPAGSETVILKAQ